MQCARQGTGAEVQCEESVPRCTPPLADAVDTIIIVPFSRFHRVKIEALVGARLSSPWRVLVVGGSCSWERDQIEGRGWRRGGG